MSAHNPGPWHWERCYIRDPNGDPVFYDPYAVTDQTDPKRPTDEPNRRLVVAAPEPLAMVKRLVDEVGLSNPIVDEARALVAKVEGT